jgi:hypothetical protein
VPVKNRPHWYWAAAMKLELMANQEQISLTWCVLRFANLLAASFNFCFRLLVVMIELDL